MGSFLVPATLAIGVLLDGGISGAFQESPALPQVELQALEYRYEPSDITVKPGEMVFVVKNIGQLDHDFVIINANKRDIAEMRALSPGESGRVTVRLDPGKYTFVCTLPGHRTKGMFGSLKVQE